MVQKITKNSRFPHFKRSRTTKSRFYQESGMWEIRCMFSTESTLVFMLPAGFFACKSSVLLSCWKGISSSSCAHRAAINPLWTCGGKGVKTNTHKKLLTAADSEDRQDGHLQYLKHDASPITSRIKWMLLIILLWYYLHTSFRFNSRKCTSVRYLFLTFIHTCTFGPL